MGALTEEDFCGFHNGFGQRWMRVNGQFDIRSKRSYCIKPEVISTTKTLVPGTA
jgi:hypothetical protein